MHIEKVVIGSNDIDASLKLRVSSFFKIVQDVIMHNTEELNVGTKETNEKGILWVISRCNVEISRLPNYQEEVICKTYPGPDKLNMIFPRYFQIEDNKGNVLIKLSSIWALIDKEKRTAIASSTIASRCIGESHEGELPLPTKIDEIETKHMENRTIHYSDVDLNGHLNNTKYIELFLDLHDSQFYKEHPIKKLTLNYLKEIKEGEQVSIFNNLSNKQEFVKIEANGVTSFFALIEY